MLQLTVFPDVATALLLASVSCAVTRTFVPAATFVDADVTMYLVAVPATVVIVALVPVTGPVDVAVTVVAVPATVWVVNVIVAIPLAFVLDVPAEKEPFALDFVHVTVTPFVATALLLASASWALIVTLLPATGEVLLDVTMYLLATPAMPVAVNVIGLPVNPVEVAVRVLLPAVAPSVQLPTVAMPPAFVVAERPVALPPPVATANVTVTPATGLLFASRTITDGAVVTAAPAVAVCPSPALIAIVVAVPATVVIVPLVPTAGVP